MYSYKQSRRREDDLAIVNAGLSVVMVSGERKDGEEEEGEEEWRVGECVLAYGGMSYVTVMAMRTQEALIGKLVRCTISSE